MSFTKKNFEWYVNLPSGQFGVPIGFEVQFSPQSFFKNITYTLSTFEENHSFFSYNFFYSLNNGETWEQYPYGNKGFAFYSSFLMRLEIYDPYANFIVAISDDKVYKISGDLKNVYENLSLPFGEISNSSYGEKDDVLLALGKDTIYKVDISPVLAPAQNSINIKDSNVLGINVDNYRGTFWQINNDNVCLKSLDGQEIYCLPFEALIDIDLSSSSSSSSSSVAFSSSSSSLLYSSSSLSSSESSLKYSSSSSSFLYSSSSSESLDDLLRLTFWIGNNYSTRSSNVDVPMIIGDYFLNFVDDFILTGLTSSGYHAVDVGYYHFDMIDPSYSFLHKKDYGDNIVNSFFIDNTRNENIGTTIPIDYGDLSLPTKDSVGISGNYVIISDSEGFGNGNIGQCYLYRRNDAVSPWGDEFIVMASDGQANDQFGRSVAIDGDYIIVGAPFDDDNGTQSGSVYIYRRTGVNVWGEEFKITPSDGATDSFFGNSVSIDGDLVIVGAYGDNSNGLGSGSVYIYKRIGPDNVWGEERKITPSDGSASDQFGWSVDISGNHVVVGARWDDDLGFNSGAIYFYERSLGDVWGNELKIIGSTVQNNDQFGYSVAIDGDYAFIKTFQLNVSNNDTYFYRRIDGNIWGEEFLISETTPNALAGEAIASVSGDYAADHEYIYERTGSNTWQIKGQLGHSGIFCIDVDNKHVAPVYLESTVLAKSYEINDQIFNFVSLYEKGCAVDELRKYAYGTLGSQVYIHNYFNGDLLSSFDYGGGNTIQNLWFDGLKDFLWIFDGTSNVYKFKNGSLIEIFDFSSLGNIHSGARALNHWYFSTDDFGVVIVRKIPSGDPTSTIIKYGQEITSCFSNLLDFEYRLNANSSFGASDVFNGKINAIVEMSNGKLLVGGDFSDIDDYFNGVARLYADGQLDASFGGTSIDGKCGSLLRLSNDKIIVGMSSLDAGQIDPYWLYGLNSDGIFDTTFSTNFILNDSVNTLEEDTLDGKIIVGGNFSNVLDGRSFLIKVNRDGVLDTSFENLNLSGRVNVVKEIEDGKFLVGGDFANVGGIYDYLIRIESDGSLDLTFPDYNLNGSVTSITKIQDGRIFVGGDFTNVGINNCNHLILLNVDGTLDESFLGLSLNNSVSVVYELPNDKLFIGGGFTDYFAGTNSYDHLIRLNSNFSIDKRFNPIPFDGKPNVILNLYDGKFLIGGDFTNLALKDGSSINDQCCNYSFLIKLLDFSHPCIGYQADLQGESSSSSSSSQSSLSSSSSSSIDSSSSSSFGYSSSSSSSQSSSSSSSIDSSSSSSSSSFSSESSESSFAFSIPYDSPYTFFAISGGSVYTMNEGEESISIGDASKINISFGLTGGSVYLQEEGALDANVKDASKLNSSIGLTGGSVYIMNEGEESISIGDASKINISFGLTGGSAYLQEEGDVPIGE